MADAKEGEERPEMRKSLSASISIVESPKTELEEYLPGQIWVKIYYMRVAGATFSSRTTVVKLDSGDLWVHNPGGPLDDDYRAALTRLGGNVKYLVTPSDFHFVYLSAWQEAFPEAETHICPGLENKKGLNYTAVMDADPPEAWKGQFKQVLIRGRMMSEVLFFHVATKTLLVFALVEYQTDECAKKDGTEGWWGRWAWVKVLGMRNKARPAVSYRLLGFKDKETVRNNLSTVIEEWAPEKLLLSHGELVDGGAPVVKELLQQCWAAFLSRPVSVSDEPAEPTPETAEQKAE